MVNGEESLASAFASDAANPVAAVACAILSALISGRHKIPLETADTTALAILLLTHERPIDPNDALFCKALERFWKN